MRVGRPLPGEQRLGISERKDRQRAEREGWSAVTIRRLADEIEHSQPVLYSHFENRDAIVAAVAIVGFREITTALQEAAREAGDHRQALENVASAYLAFALEHPALYEAMFTLPTGLRFAEVETRSELKAAFDSLAAVFTLFRTDVTLATETFWASLHGLAELERSGRIMRSARAERVALVVRGLLGR
jgi:AcrR family transcriptional regulator